MGAIPSSVLRSLEEDRERYGGYRIVTTVRHTGTHSIMEQFPGYKHWHCNPVVLDLIKNNPDAHVITTYRDPLDTAASWHKRGKFQHDGFIGIWGSEWFYYYKIIEIIPPENIYPIESLKYHLYRYSEEPVDD